MSESRDELHERSLVAVYERREEAEAVVREVERLGVDPHRVRLGDAADERASLVAQMQAEAGEALIVPAVGGAYPPQSSRSLIRVGGPVLLVCILLALPLALIPFGLAFWARLLLMAAVGAMVGGAIALVIGPALGIEGQDRPPTDHPGTSVRVEDPTEEVRAALLSGHPVRMDELEG